MRSLRLRIEPPEGVASEQVIAGEHALVGRASNADVVLADTLVSRQHARFSRRADAWWVEDLGALNKTFVNDRPLTTPVLLNVGDVVRIGDTRIRVLEEPTRPTGIELPSQRSGRDPVFVKTSVPLPPSPSDVTHDGHAARLQLLNEVHHALAKAIALPDLLDLILERCFAVLRPEQGVILLADASGELQRTAWRSLPGQSQDLTVARRIVEEVAHKGQSALVLDAAQDARFADSESIVATGIRSVVAAPLLDASGTLGMIALYSRVNVRRFTAADLALLESLASAAALRVRNVALAEEAAARRVLEHELTLAHDIQMALLPRAMPDSAAVEVAGRLQPARSVGGDLYDVVVDGDRLWLIVGDVSGKGVAAALYMAVARTLFRALVPGATSLAEVVTRMNRELCRDNDKDMFVTALVGLVVPSLGTVTLCDAGHNPPIVLRREGVAYRPTLNKSIVLGVRAEATFTETPLRLGPGDMLVAYTDGITEARNAEGEAFDLPRLERTLVALAREPIDRVVAGVVHAVEQFTGGAVPEDDIALLALRLKKG